MRFRIRPRCVIGSLAPFNALCGRFVVRVGYLYHLGVKCAQIALFWLVRRFVVLRFAVRAWKRSAVALFGMLGNSWQFGKKWQILARLRCLAGAVLGWAWLGGGFASLVDFKAVFSAVRGSARFGYGRGCKRLLERKFDGNGGSV